MVEVCEDIEAYIKNTLFAAQRDYREVHAVTIQALEYLLENVRLLTMRVLVTFF